MTAAQDAHDLMAKHNAPPVEEHLAQLSQAITCLADDQVIQDEILSKLIMLRVSGVLSGQDLAKLVSQHCRESMPASSAATSSFDPYGDFESRGYLRIVTQDKDPKIIKHIEHTTFAANHASARDFLVSQETISFQSFLRTHESLFRDIYPWAGQDRSVTSPELVISKGKGPSRIEFSPPGEIQRSVGYALSMAKDPKIMRSKPGEVLGCLAYAHPFLDGNGRAMLVLHNELCRRSGFRIDWMKADKSLFLTNLTIELNTPSRRAMDAYLKPLMTGV